MLKNLDESLLSQSFIKDYKPFHQNMITNWFKGFIPDTEQEQCLGCHSGSDSLDWEPLLTQIEKTFWNVADVKLNCFAQKHNKYVVVQNASKDAENRVQQLCCPNAVCFFFIYF